MKVSIITPCYNSSNYIAQTIDSVQHQTITDWEMIIVDDGSTDNSVDIIKTLLKKDKRIKLVQKENGGSASARNVGLSYAQGEYIQFLDADDTIDPYKFENQITLMENLNLDVSYTDYQITADINNTNNPQRGINISLFRILTMWGVFGTIPLHSFLYRLSFLKNNQISNCTEIREREDWDFHIQVLSHNPKIKRLKGYCGAYYFRCPTGKTSCGSHSKLQKGTFRFLLYKIRKAAFYQKVLLELRLSIGLIDVTMLALRRKINITNDIIPLFDQSFFTFLIFFIAILLLPISAIIYIIRYIWIRTQPK